MTAFVLDTFYPINDTDGITFTFGPETLTGIPSDLHWWISNLGETRQGSALGDQYIEVTDDYYGFNTVGFISAKGQTFDYRYNAPYYGVIIDATTAGFVDLASTSPGFPGTGTPVNFKTSNGGDTIYSGTLDVYSGIAVRIINVSPDLSEGFIWIELIAPPSTISFGMTWFFSP